MKSLRVLDAVHAPAVGGQPSRIVSASLTSSIYLQLVLLTAIEALKLFFLDAFSLGQLLTGERQKVRHSSDFE